MKEKEVSKLKACVSGDDVTRMMTHFSFLLVCHMPLRDYTHQIIRFGMADKLFSSTRGPSTSLSHGDWLMCGHKGVAVRLCEVQPAARTDCRDTAIVIRQPPSTFRDPQPASHACACWMLSQCPTHMTPNLTRRIPSLSHHRHNIITATTYTYTHDCVWSWVEHIS